MSLEALKAKLAAAKNKGVIATVPVIGSGPEGQQFTGTVAIKENGDQKLIDLNEIKQDTTELPTQSDSEITALEAHPLADKVQFIQAKLSDLAAAIEQNAPGYKSILLQIDKILRTYKELTYLLNEDEIQVIVSGLIKDSDAQFTITPATKGGGKGKKASGKVVKELDIGSEDDI